MSARSVIASALCLLVGSALQASAPVIPDLAANAQFTPQALATACKDKDGWADPAPPAHLHGNTWYVGTCGITALLVTTPEGHVLIDAGVPEAAPLVAANIKRLGFSLSDVRWIVTSHEHFDHVGAVAELQRLTGARLAALQPAARVLRTGIPSRADPQYALLIQRPMTPARVDRILRDGASLTIGGTTLTAHATPAHSPGSTSWIWQSCEAKSCQTMTYADSTSTISADDYRFPAHPDRIAAVRKGLGRVADLPCGVLMTPHPSASDLFERMASGLKPDPTACPAYAKAATERFVTRLAADAKAMQQTSKIAPSQ